MSGKCTPAEIAEKRRIALERLQGNKKQEARTGPEQCPAQKIPGKLTSDQKAKIEHNRNQAIERRRAIMDAEAKALIDKKVSKAPAGKAESALKAANSRPHPYLPNATSVQAPNPIPEPSKVPMNRSICNFEVVSLQRFQARLDKYNETVLNSFKKISSSKFDSPSTWSFALEDYESLISELAKIKDHVITKPVPEFCMKYLREKSPVIDKTCLQSIEPTLEQTLKDFQREGVCFGVSRGGRFILADDPGLGKTRQALAVANFYKSDFPLLIIAPATVRDFWRNQIIELMPNVNMLDIAVIDQTNKNVGLAKVVIVAYTSLERHMEKLKEKRFGVVIFDESHRLKEPSTKQTVNATILGKQATRAILLSGTPALSRPKELFQQLAIIDERFTGFRSFAERYCEGKPGKFGFEANGSSNLNELKALLSKKFMIRRTKDDVFSELGTKERIIVELPIVKDEKAAQNMLQYSQNFQSAVAKKQEHAFLIQWYSATAGLKAVGVCSFISDFISKSKDKFLVFGHHHSILYSVQCCLKKIGVKFIRIDGETKAEIRDQNVQKFQSDSDIRCAVLSLKACSVGITLTAASTVIFAELHWTPAEIIQAEGRVHRIGQEQQVKCYFLLAPGTADDVMWKMLLQKQSNINKAGLFSDNEQFSTGIARTKFQPGTSTSSKTPKKTIGDYFVKTPRKSDDMDSSDSFMTCRSSFGDAENTDVEMAEPEINNNNESEKVFSTQDLEAFFLEMPSYPSQPQKNSVPIEDNKFHSTQDLEARFLEMPSYPSEPQKNSVQTKAFRNTLPPAYDSDEEFAAITLEIDKEEKRKQEERSGVFDDLADIIFSDED